jgi:carboxyl-terminal processing protease
MNMLRCSAKSRTVAGFSLLGLLVLASVSALGANLTAPSDNDRQVTLAVTPLLKHDHFLHLKIKNDGHPSDVEISQRCFKNFLQALDPMKIYFYQSDIDEFSKYRDDLANETQRGDIGFAYMVMKTFLARVDERVKMIDEILATPPDFTLDEQMVVDKDTATYARTQADAKEIWRKKIKYDLLVLKAEKAEKAEDGEKSADKPDPGDGKTPEQRLTQRYHSFAKRMRQTDSEELLEMYLTALTTSFDPHTTYMSPSSVDNFQIMMQLKLEGIGASLQGEDGYTVVKRLVPGGAAEKEGHLKLDDKIIGVGEGETGLIVDVVDMKLNDVVKMIRGKPGTIVRLQLVSVKDPKPRTIKITRATIELKDSEARGEIFNAGRRADGTAYRIGVINLPSFYMDTNAARMGQPDFKSPTRDCRRILDTFKSQGVDAVVLDLRNNGGGSLSEAISLTGLFIPEGPVVQVKDADGRVTPYNDYDPGVAWSGPLVVLVSKFSASASEILAGAIQDYHRGLIVGDHSTHGKGSVQSLLDLGAQLFRIPNSPKMGELKITMQQFYRPGGDSTQQRGVLSDVELPSLTTHLKVGEKDLEYSLPFDHVAPQPFNSLGQVDAALVDQLRRQSAARCAAAEKFQKVERKIASYKEQEAKKYVTLNEAKFLKDRAEFSDKEEEKTLEKLSKNPSGIERDFYLDEVFNVTIDFMNLGQVAKIN